jgi:DHA1 family tetracycline resistance protein-like MFS transporter
MDWKRANPLGALKHLKKYPLLIGLVASFFLLYLAGKAVESTWTFYTMLKFQWSEAWVGYSLAVVGIIVAIVQGGLIKVIMNKIGTNNSIYLGLCFEALGLILFAFAAQGWMMMVFLLPYALGGISGPAMQGMISNQVPANEQGELQGALTSLISITSILGPLIMNNLFAYFTGSNAPFYFPGIPFIAGVILIAGSLFFAAKTLKNKKS